MRLGVVELVVAVAWLGVRYFSIGARVMVDER